MKRLILTFSLVVVTSQALSALTLTSFGTSDFTLIGETGWASGSNTTSQGANDIVLAGLDGGLFQGNFTSTLDITGVSTIYLFGTLNSGTPTTTFTLDLFDSNFTNKARFTGADWTTLGDNGFTTFTLQSTDGGFVATDVRGLDLTLNGITDTAFNATFNNLTTVPEPSAYAAIAGVLVLGFTAVRRRRRA